MQDSIRELLTRRKNRAAAIILGVKDDECDFYLPEDVSKSLRKAILDQMNDFYDVCVDVIESLDNESYVMNDHYLEKIDEIYMCIVEDRILEEHSVKVDV